MPNSEKNPKLDKFIEKVISRKFLAWITATFLLGITGNLTSSDWVTITAIYIGGQTVVDAVDSVIKLRSADKNNNHNNNLL
jgi:hypothetical protein